jgi:hypothetical protein
MTFHGFSFVQIEGVGRLGGYRVEIGKSLVDHFKIGIK